MTEISQAKEGTGIPQKPPGTVVCTYLDGCDARARQPTKIRVRISEGIRRSRSIRHRSPDRPQSSVNGRPIGFSRNDYSKELEMPIGRYTLRRPRQDMEAARSKSCQTNACPIDCRCQSHSLLRHRVAERFAEPNVMVTIQ